MAGKSKLRVQLGAEFDVDSGIAKAQADASKKSITIPLKFNFDTNDIEKRFQEIKSSVDSMASMTAKKNALGVVDQYTLNYVDQYKNKYSEIWRLTESIDATTGKTVEKWVSTSRVMDGVGARQKELNNSLQKANEFLAKAANMDKTSKVKAAMAKAEEIKVAVSEGDVAKVAALTEQFKEMQAGLTGAKVGLQSWSESLGRAIKQTVSYAITTGALYTALAQLRQGLQYVVDLNREMVNIQVLQVQGASSPGEVAALANQYNVLAKEMGVTTLEVAKGSTEWLRQGKTIAETQELLRSTLMLSKLGALDSAQATEYLTSILNGFQMEATKAEDVVNKLVAIDNMAATSSGELATAMQYSSAIAKDSGVSFEKLAAMIGVVSSTTRLSAEMIGQAFRTMFVRMQSVKAGEIDETGMSLNNVEKTLSGIGISLRDTTKSFRPLEDVIADVAGIWGQLDEVTKAQISNAIAGQRQAQMFAVLMQNWGDMAKYVGAETASAGLAQDRYAIYLQGVEAAQNRVTASWERLSQTAVSSGAVSDLYNTLAAVLDLMSQMGGIPTILTVIISSLTAFNVTSLATTAGITTMTDAWAALESAFEANPLGFVVMGIGAVVLALNYLNETTEETRIRLQNLQQEVSATRGSLSKLSTQKSTIQDLWGELESLNAKTSLTNSEQQRFYEIQSQIRDILPQVSGYYDEQGQFIINESVNLQELLALKQEEIDIEREKLALQANKNIEEEIEAYKNLRKEMELFKNGPQMYLTKKYGSREQQEDKIKNDLLVQKEYINQIKSNYYSLEKTQQEVLLSMLENGDALDQEIARQLKSVADTVNDTKGEITNGALTTSPDMAPFVSGVADAMNTLKDKVVQMIKDMKNAEKDALQDELRDYKDYIDEQKQLAKDAYDAKKAYLDEEKKQLDRQYENEKRNRDARKNAIKDQLDAYKKIISAQKEILRQQKEQADYEKTREDKQEKLARLQEEILTLSLDDSAEAQAQRLQLEQEAADLQEEINNDAADHQYDLEQNALDQEQQNAEDSAQILLDQIEREQEAADLRHELKLREIEDAQDAAKQEYDILVRSLEDQYNAKEKQLNDQIAAIDAYLAKEGQINQDAMDMIKNHSEELYAQLIQWNKDYGTGIDNDIIAIWEAAIAKVQEYGDAVNALPSSPTTESPYIGTGTNNMDDDWKEHHSGINAGVVGGLRLKSNEEFIKALRGEVYVTPKQADEFMTKNLPRMISSASYTTNNNSGSPQISISFPVAGNLDKTVIPEIEKVVKKAVEQLNKNLLIRGMNRRAESFSL
jgi:TP901 family phage tail tape measure protein